VTTRLRFAACRRSRRDTGRDRFEPLNDSPVAEQLRELRAVPPHGSPRLAVIIAELLTEERVSRESCADRPPPASSPSSTPAASTSCTATIFSGSVADLSNRDPRAARTCPCGGQLAGRRLRPRPPRSCRPARIHRPSWAERVFVGGVAGRQRPARSRVATSSMCAATTVVEDATLSPAAVATRVADRPDGVETDDLRRRTGPPARRSSLPSTSNALPTHSARRPPG